MKEMKLLKALSNVDERYLKELNEPKVTRKRPGMKLVWVAAAALSLAAVLMGSATVRLWPAINELGKLPLTDPAQVIPENIKLTVSEVNPVSMKVECQVAGMENEENSIFILPNGPFTLDRKTEEGWEPLEAKYEDPLWRSDEMLTAGNTDWYVNWSGIYGLLEPGTYRYNAVVLEGKTPTSVEFTINKQLEPELKELLDSVLTSHSYHVRSTITSETTSLEHLSKEDLEAVAAITEGQVMEYRKYGDQLLVLDYVESQPEQPWTGMMLKNGKKYQLDHEGDNRTNPVIGWSLWPELDRNRLTYWITNILYYGNDCELNYGPDGSVESVSVVTKDYSQAYDITITWTQVWEFDTTDPGDVAAAIARQNVNKPRSFDWAQEQKIMKPLETTFNNTQPQPITTAPEAAQRALAECTVEHTKVIVYHDEAAGIWKVEFQNFYGRRGYQYVYMDNNGITQAIATGAPRA